MDKIVIASVLKPLKDSRAYYKFGLSLRETNKYRVNIIGFSSKNEPQEGNISFHPLLEKGRKSTKRMLAGFRFLLKLLAIRPKLVIITTYELLPFAVLAKKLMGFRLIYDIQENYVMNLDNNPSLSGFKKSLFAFFIGKTERLFMSAVDHFLLAEKSYLKEFTLPGPSTVFENTYFENIKKTVKTNLSDISELRFLISGTITEVYGIKDALEWFLEILKTFPSAQLHIIGHCTLPDFGEKLRTLSDGHPEIRLEIEEHPVAYQRILEAYKKADLILLPYQQTPSIRHKIPSKMYEAMALGKPMIYTPNAAWQKLTMEINAGFPLDFKDLNHASENLRTVLQNDFFISQMPASASWKFHEKRFLNLIQNLLEERLKNR